jgi:hypothetical protein
MEAPLVFWPGTPRLVRTSDAPGRNTLVGRRVLASYIGVAILLNSTTLGLRSFGTVPFPLLWLDRCLASRIGCDVSVTVVGYNACS